jgi:diketogulonate reductase-like aldo/keto reductase
LRRRPQPKRREARSRTTTRAGRIYELGHATERVAAAAEAAGEFVLTGRAENHIRGNPDLDDTIARLQAYERAGADVLYAPGLATTEEIRAVCGAVSKPVNVLARANLTFDEMAEAGAQRISVGGALTWVAVAGSSPPPNAFATPATSQRSPKASRSTNGSEVHRRNRAVRPHAGTGAAGGAACSSRALARPLAELRRRAAARGQPRDLRRAFDLGITHIDLANNYGPPYGSAEETFGRIMRDDLRPYRDELVISTKAGYDMWPGPYGEWGSRKYLLASLDQSLKRMGLEYVDIFYSHRFDPDTPLEETMGALDTAVATRQGALRGHLVVRRGADREAARILRDLGTPLLIHQPSYSMLNRWIEPELLDTLEDEGVGCIVFSPLAQGMFERQVPERHPGGVARKS